MRGPSPLIHQWIEFCLQAARALPFKQEVIPGSSPSVLQSHLTEVPVELTNGRPNLDTNLIAGAPPPNILERCEFLEPLSNSALSDYHWLLANSQESGHGLTYKMHQYISSMFKFSRNPDPKLTWMKDFNGVLLVWMTRNIKSAMMWFNPAIVLPRSRTRGRNQVALKPEGAEAVSCLKFLNKILTFW